MKRNRRATRRNLKTRPAEDANGGTGPRNSGVEVIEQFPGLVEVQESRNVEDFAAVSKIDRVSLLLELVMAGIRV